MQSKDIGLGAASMIFGAWMLFMANHIKPGAAFWPKIVASIIIILGVVILAFGIKAYKNAKNKAKKKALSPKAKPQYVKVIGVIGLLILHYYAFQYFSYTISTFLLISITSIILGYRNWKVMISTSALVSIFLYLVFVEVFGIHFPGAFF